MPSGWPTAGEVINRAARRLALTKADVTDPFGSPDPNLLQLAALLTEVGERLARTHAWTHLQKTHAFSTVAATEDYALPDDYLRTLDQTHWNRSTDRPLIGPAAPHEWQALKALDTDFVTSKVFRVVGDRFFVHPVPTAAEDLAFEYVSRWWVREDGQAEPNEEVADMATDELRFDRHLLVAALKLEFLGEKGFDTAKAQNDFELAFQVATASDGAAPPLSLSGSGPRLHRGLAWWNLPDEGFGG